MHKLLLISLSLLIMNPAFSQTGQDSKPHEKLNQRIHFLPILKFDGNKGYTYHCDCEERDLYCTKNGITILQKKKDRHDQALDKCGDVKVMQANCKAACDPLRAKRDGKVAQDDAWLKVRNERLNEYTACEKVYAERLLRTESRRAKRTAGAVYAGVIALFPVFTPLGAATLGSFALVMASSGSGAKLVNEKSAENKAHLVPDSLKELMLFDAAINPKEDYYLKDETAATLFGRDVGYEYQISPQTKDELLARFTKDLKEKAAKGKCTKELSNKINEEAVRAAILNMKDGKELCTNAKGKVKALNLRNFRKVVFEQIKSQNADLIALSEGCKDTGESDLSDSVNVVESAVKNAASEMHKKSKDSKATESATKAK